MKSNYVIWDVSLDQSENFCVLDGIGNVEKSFELTKGVPRLHNFTDFAIFSMDPEYPKSIALADNVYNVNDLIIASKQLKEFIEDRTPKHIEYLPATIYNHKERIASDTYYIIHPVHLQDALDIEKCDCTWSEILQDKISSIENLVVDEGCIDPKVIIFRLKYFYRPIFISRDLSEEITAAGFTGIRWIELSDYPED